jgi:hypothetical protein
MLPVANLDGFSKPHCINAANFLIRIVWFGHTYVHAKGITLFHDLDDVTHH